MAALLEFDPLTGIRRYIETDEVTGVTTLTTEQDVSGLLEHTKRLRNEGATDGGIKKGWWHYASIPPLIELKMRQKGIDLLDPNSTRRIIQEINEHYPALKVTNKNDSGTAPRIYIPPVPRAE